MGAAMSLTASATRIVILSDIHVTPGNANDSKLREAVAEINAMNDVDLVVVDGDLSNEGSDEQLANVKATLDQIRHPQYVLPGNHENNWSQSATKTFVDLWGNDRFITGVDDLVIVGINCGPFMKMGDGHIKQEDLHWLKATLDGHVAPGKRVVSFNHYPLQADLDNCDDYIQVLEKYPVIAHINGHYHRYNKYMGGDIDCMMVRALDTGKGNYGYSIMDITPDSVIILDKRLGVAPARVEAWKARTELKPIERKPLPEVKVDGFAIDKVWTDSASIFTRLGFDADNLYFGNSLGYVTAVDKATGARRWSAPTGASLFSRPVAGGGMVAVPAAVHELIAYDAATGRRIGSRDSSGPYVADGVVADGALYQGGYKKMEKWDAETGQLLWRFDSIDNYCQAAPVVAGDDVIFGAWDTNLYCLDASTGALKWKWNNGKSANMLGPGNVVPVVTDDKVIIVAPDRYMTALDRKTGRQLWRDNKYRYRESLGHSEDYRYAYAKTMDGQLVAVDITAPEFKEAWMVDMGIGYDHAPCIVLEKDGVVYAGSRRGIVTAVDPVAQKVIWSAPLGVSEINGFDVDPSTGDVYLSLIEGTVWRIRPAK